MLVLSDAHVIYGTKLKLIIYEAGSRGEHEMMLMHWKKKKKKVLHQGDNNSCSEWLWMGDIIFTKMKKCGHMFYGPKREMLVKEWRIKGNMVTASILSKEPKSNCLPQVLSFLCSHKSEKDRMERSHSQGANFVWPQAVSRRTIDGLVWIACFRRKILSFFVITFPYHLFFSHISNRYSNFFYEKWRKMQSKHNFRLGSKFTI